MSLLFEKLTQFTTNSDFISVFKLREAYRWLRVRKKEGLMWRNLVCRVFTHGNPGIKLQECVFLAYGVKVLRMHWLNVLKRPQFLQRRWDTVSYVSRARFCLQLADP